MKRVMNEYIKEHNSLNIMSNLPVILLLIPGTEYVGGLM